LMPTDYTLGCGRYKQDWLQAMIEAET